MSATATTTTLPAGTYIADPIHSTFGFQVRHNGVQLFRGSFDDVAVTAVSDGETVSIEGSAKVESLNVRLADLKGHLLADEFFAADKHPEVAFRSSAVRVDGETVEVEGELTIKGITNHVVAKGTLSGPVVGLGGQPVLGLALETAIDRTQYGLNWQAELPSGGKALANEVKIVVEAELVKAEG
ncbi:MAG: YceI family protein [Actinobacteria bacterium]|nr:MAG: YceI family protein [Actinomycetota bacterium]